jgi:hypothetical protein
VGNPMINDKWTSEQMTNWACCVMGERVLRPGWAGYGE